MCELKNDRHLQMKNGEIQRMHTWGILVDKIFFLKIFVMKLYIFVRVIFLRPWNFCDRMQTINKSLAPW